MEKKSKRPSKCVDNHSYPCIFAFIKPRREPSDGREEAKLNERKIAKALTDFESVQLAEKSANEMVRRCNPPLRRRIVAAVSEEDHRHADSFGRH